MTSQFSTRYFGIVYLRQWTYVWKGVDMQTRAPGLVFWKLVYSLSSSSFSTNNDTKWYLHLIWSEKYQTIQGQRAAWWYGTQRNVPMQLTKMGGQMRLHRAKLGLAPGLSSMALNTASQHSPAALWEMNTANCLILIHFPSCGDEAVKSDRTVSFPAKAQVLWKNIY